MTGPFNDLDADLVSFVMVLERQAAVAAVPITAAFVRRPVFSGLQSGAARTCIYAQLNRSEVTQ